jgi:hypothetical protein
MLALLLDGALYAGDNIVAPVIAAFLTTLATSKWLRPRDTSGQVADHDRRAAELNEDLRRWVRDRQRQADVRMSQVAEDARSKGVASEKTSAGFRREGVSARPA